MIIINAISLGGSRDYSVLQKARLTDGWGIRNTPFYSMTGNPHDNLMYEAKQNFYV